MGLHRITQAVNAGDGRIGRSIEADTIAGTGNIIIDRRRDADDIDAGFRQRPGPTERAVAADGDHAVQPEEFAVVIRLLLPCRGAEFLAAGCIEHRAAPVDDMRDGQRVHPLDIPVDQAAPAPPDADALEPPVHAGADDSANCRIHPRRVAAAGQNADPFDFLFHLKNLLSPAESAPIGALSVSSNRSHKRRMRCRFCRLFQRKLPCRRHGRALVAPMTIIAQS